MLLGAISVAQHRVSIVTPYFLPDDVLLRARMTAALRGVDVHIVLPQKSNIGIVDWAIAPQLPYLPESGCRIHFTPPPFDHTKLFVIDGFWSFIGSINWDVRSLRLNFEFNLECYCEQLAQYLENLVDARITTAHSMTVDEARSLPVFVQLRNGLARLLSPYL